jgi:catechol 2,3-dioxygenase
VGDLSFLDHDPGCVPLSPRIIEPGRTAGGRIANHADQGLKHIALKSRDLQKTEEFYTGILGMKVAFRHPPAMLFLTTPRSGDLINFVRSNSRPKGTQSLEHLGFKITAAGLKKTEKTLKAHGVKIDGRRGKTAIYFRDPNGYQLEFYCD